MVELVPKIHYRFGRRKWRRDCAYFYVILPLTRASSSSVAQRLGRAFVLYDKFSFDAGTNFISSIEAGLQASTLFCFFLSANSLKSDWVKHELSEAQNLFIRGHLRKIIIIAIDKSDIHTIPSWLKHARIVSLNSVSQIEREIRYHLSVLLRDESSTIFVGRRRELELAERLLAPVDTLVEPHVFCFFGLAGIGRKTVCRQIANDLLSFPKMATFRIDDGDDLSDILVKFGEDLTPSKNRDEIRGLVDQIENLDEQQKLERFTDLAGKYIDARELIVFQDEGGLLDNDGFLSEDIGKLITAVTSNSKLRLALISRRKPSFEKPDDAFPCIRVPQA